MGMLIHEHTVIRAADTDMRTRSYINALFWEALDLDVLVFGLFERIVNLITFLIDNRNCTLLFRVCNAPQKEIYRFRTDTWARCPSCRGYAREAGTDRAPDSHCLRR